MQGIAEVKNVNTGVTTLTLMQLVAATNHRVEVIEIGISFDGINNTHKPIDVDVLRQTSAGTSSALTLHKADDSLGDSFDVTALKTFTAEPTDGALIPRPWHVHPQTGLIYPVPSDAPIWIGAGDRLGLRVLAANAVEATAYILFRE